MVVSGAHLTLATHYCGGKVAATKISLTGKLASCGMEGTESTCPVSGNNINSHCCNNQVSTFGMANTFTAPVSVLSEKSENVLNFYFLPEVASFTHIQDLRISFTDTGPPGGFPANAVSLNNICVFRI